MDRPVRRARQRMPQTDVVGLLPQEEAAIKRALYESLLEDKKKTPPKAAKQGAPSLHASSSSHPTSSLPPLDIAHHSASYAYKASESSSSASQWTRVEHRDRERDGSTEGEYSETGCKPLQKRRRLHSPLSPSQSFDSSNGSKSSSPTPFRGLSRISPSSPLSSPVSVESSLKLVLSTSSWSRSSSSSWSPSPEPGNEKTSVKVYLQPKTTAKILRVIKTGKGKAEPKAKRAVGRPRKHPLTPQLKKGSKKSSPGSQKSMMPKIPRTYTKSALKLNKQLSASLKARGKQPAGKRVYKRQKNKLTAVSQTEPNSEKDASPMSPEMALVMHDHCYSSSSSSHQDSAPGGKESLEDSANRKPHANNASPYQAQRKFAQNQAPVYTHRPSTDEVENVSGLKEIPRTEDFITFLCLRGSERMPTEFDKFAIPWTPLRKKKGSRNGQKVSIRRRTLPFVSVKGSRPKSGGVSKKLDLTNLISSGGCT